MEILQPSLPQDQRRALAVLMARPDLPASQTESQIDTLLAYAETYGLSLENLLVATQGTKSLAACLCVDSPGRISSVFLPADLSDPIRVDASAHLLHRGSALAADRKVQLLQAMLDAEAHPEAEILQKSGFNKVAKLLYLERDLAVPLDPPSSRPSLDWERYEEDKQPLFLRVLQATYDASLDCPALNGQRDIQDILASHRAAGRFDPRGWAIAKWEGEAVGIVLVNPFIERLTSEIVYMGVLRSFRQQGFGSAIIRQAIRIAREQQSLTLALTVDEVNTPARRLYERFGFQETARRDAWIKFLS
jgi:mycothiol synthase